jgi:hypothetical protein
MNLDQSNIEFLSAKYSRARDKYKPRDIKTLIIAEAPPCTLERFFYFEEVSRQDSLFLEIMGVLYPEEKEEYLRSKREPSKKEGLLERFREDGFWLLDLAEVPIEVSNQTYESALPSLINRIEKAIDKTTPVILIKANVYDICYKALLAKGYNVVNERLPFPGSGQQRVFRDKFKKLVC